jgi:hypothetical protein
VTGSCQPRIRQNIPRQPTRLTRQTKSRTKSRTKKGGTGMDGSSASLIAIPIVVVVVLAAWLIMVAYAAGHPRWKHGQPATGDANPGPAAQPDAELPSTVAADATPQIPHQHDQLAA